jgi:hypothetical protein
MAITLTSFKKSKEYPGEKFSIARFQPQGFQYRPLSFLGAEGPKGEHLRLSNFEDPTDFVKEYKAGIQARWIVVQQWLKTLEESKDIVLCCWCPYSAHSLEQFKRDNIVYCHSGLIGKLINHHCPDITVLLDSDRFYHLYEPWRPISGPADKEPEVTQQLSLF